MRSLILLVLFGLVTLLFPRQYNFLECYQTPRRIKIDGQLDDWDLSRPILLDSLEQLDKEGSIKLWGGKQDLSATVYLSFDEQNFYIAVSVIDDKIINKHRFTPNLWQGDCVEVVFDTSLEDKEIRMLNEDDFHFLFVPPTSSFKRCSWRALRMWIDETGEQRAREFETLGLEAQAEVNSVGYTLELKIPFLYLRGINPHQEKEIRFNILIDDADEEEWENAIIINGQGDISRNTDSFIPLAFRGLKKRRILSGFASFFGNLRNIFPFLGLILGVGIFFVPLGFLVNYFIFLSQRKRSQIFLRLFLALGGIIILFLILRFSFEAFSWQRLEKDKVIVKNTLTELKKLDYLDLSFRNWRGAFLPFLKGMRVKHPPMYKFEPVIFERLIEEETKRDTLLVDFPMTEMNFNVNSVTKLTNSVEVNQKANRVWIVYHGSGKLLLLKRLPLERKLGEIQIEFEDGYQKKYELIYGLNIDYVREEYGLKKNNAYKGKLARIRVRPARVEGGGEMRKYRDFFLTYDVPPKYRKVNIARITLRAEPTYFGAERFRLNISSITLGKRTEDGRWQYQLIKKYRYLTSLSGIPITRFYSYSLQGGPKNLGATRVVIPVNKLGEKLFFFYSSEGYLMEFGSPFGTHIASFIIHYQDGKKEEIELLNGINIDSNFEHPPTMETEIGWWRAWGETHVDELEHDCREVVIKEIEFIDTGTLDIPSLFGITLAQKKERVFPQNLKYIAFDNTHFWLKKKLSAQEFILVEKEKIFASTAPEELEFTFGEKYAKLGGQNYFLSYLALALPGGQKYQLGFLKSFGIIEKVKIAFGIIVSLLGIILLCLIIIMGVSKLTALKYLRRKLITSYALCTFIPVITIFLIILRLVNSQMEHEIKEDARNSLRIVKTIVENKIARIEAYNERFFEDEKVKRQLLTLPLEREDYPERALRILEDYKENILIGEEKVFLGLEEYVFRKAKGDYFKRVIFTPDTPLELKRRPFIIKAREGGIVLDELAGAVISAFKSKIVSERTTNFYIFLPIKKETLLKQKMVVKKPIKIFSRKGYPVVEEISEEFDYNTQNINKRNVLFTQLSPFLPVATQRISKFEQFHRLRGYTFFGKRDKPQAVISVDVSPVKFLKVRNQMLGIIIGIALIFLGVSALIGYMFTQNITTPIFALQQATREVERGNFEHQLEPTSRDEIGYLMQGFNSMIKRIRETTFRLRQRIRELAALNRAIRNLSQYLDKEKIIEVSVALLAGMVNPRIIALLLKLPEGNEWEIVGSEGILGKKRTLVLNPKEGILGRVILTRAPQIARSPQVLSQKEKYLFEGFKVIYAFPFIAQEEILGGVFIVDPNTKVEERDQIRFLSTFTSQIAISLQNAFLYEMAITDGLTKLFIKRYFDTQLIHEIHRSHRYHHKMSLLMIDIDHFKQINDTYGHLAGNLVLKKIGEILRTQSRTVDIVSRYGGEEFTIILPESDKKCAYQMAERLRQKVAEEEFEISHTPGSRRIRVTISIGIACFPEDALEKEALIGLADKYLYQAKLHGRNRVCYAS
jgi:diguanylate cyclase (GGDEF)-like protein